MSRNNYSIPRGTGTGGGGGGTGTSIEKVYDRFEVYDDTSQWKSMPRKIITENGNDFLVFAGSVAEIYYTGAYFKAFGRSLVLNQDIEAIGTSERKKRLIPIQRPVGKKAYLHSVLYAYYDYNEIIPQITEALIDQITFARTGLNGTDPSGLVFYDAFGTGINGVALAMNPGNLSKEMGYIKSNYTTADYPFSHFKYLANGEPDSLYMRKWRLSEIQYMEKYGITAPMSNIYHGMINSDFLVNEFALKIGALTGAGYDDTSITLPISEMNIWDSELRTDLTGVDKNQSLGNDDVDVYKRHGSDLFIPQVQNEIDVLIPDLMNYLTVDVAGPGWTHGIDLVEKANNVKLAYTNSITNDKIVNVIVQMPVKVQLIIRYE